eukprot:353453-Chlamydomonas_euryale.AAC.7
MPVCCMHAGTLHECWHSARMPVCCMHAGMLHACWHVVLVHIWGLLNGGGWQLSSLMLWKCFCTCSNRRSRASFGAACSSGSGSGRGGRDRGRGGRESGREALLAAVALQVGLGCSAAFKVRRVTICMPPRTGMPLVTGPAPLEGVRSDVAVGMPGAQGCPS